MTDKLRQKIALVEALPKVPRRRRIVDHTDQELDAAIAKAAATIPNFFVILHGVDAYMERRRRGTTRSTPGDRKRNSMAFALSLRTSGKGADEPFSALSNVPEGEFEW